MWGLDFRIGGQLLSFSPSPTFLRLRAGSSDWVFALFLGNWSTRTSGGCNDTLDSDSGELELVLSSRIDGARFRTNRALVDDCPRLLATTIGGGLGEGIVSAGWVSSSSCLIGGMFFLPPAGGAGGTTRDPLVPASVDCSLELFRWSDREC